MSSGMGTVDLSGLKARVAAIQAGHQALAASQPQAIATQVAALAYVLCPVGPDPTRPAGRPHTRDTIAVVPGLTPDTWQVVVTGPAADKIEYGTRHMPARPFLAPAGAQVAPSAEADVRGALQALYAGGGT